MWHTSLTFKISSRAKKILFIGLLSSFLLGTGAYSCGGGGAPGGGSGIGGVGGAGAPPVAIPAPEALNMTNITISAPDATGTVTVTGSPGAALPNADVRVRNLGPEVSWRQKIFLNSAYAAIGDEVIVKANAAGAFAAQIKAVIGDRIALAQKTALKPATSIEIYGVVSDVPVKPDKVVPANQAKPFMKSKMVVDPNGNVWQVQSSSSKKWNWLDLFISTAHADDLSLQNVTDVSCPQIGPCVTKPSKAPHESYCRVSKSDGSDKELLSFFVPYCKEINKAEMTTLKGPPDVNYMALAAGNNGIVMKEASPDKWVVAEVLRFNTPITGVESDVQANDLVFYFSAAQGFYSYSVKSRAVTFYLTKIGQMSFTQPVIPTAFAKRGSHVVYAATINGQAWVVQGDVVLDPGFTFQQVLTSMLPKPVSEILILETDVAKSVELQSGKLAYRANEIAFISGRTLYLMEVPTNRSRQNDLVPELPNHADLDLSKLEKLVSLPIPEGVKDLTMIANNPNQTILAVSDGDKVYYADYTYGETIPLQAMRLSRVTDLRSDGGSPAASLAYNPVTGSFVLRGLGEINLGSGQEGAGPTASPAAPRAVSISISDRSTPDAPFRMGPREMPSSRDQVEITVRSPARPTSSATSPGSSAPR